MSFLYINIHAYIMISIYVTPIISGIFFLLVVDACHESAWDTLQMRFFGSPGGFPYGYIMISIYAHQSFQDEDFFRVESKTKAELAAAAAVAAGAAAAAAANDDDSDDDVQVIEYSVCVYIYIYIYIYIYVVCIYFIYTRLSSLVCVEGFIRRCDMTQV